MGFWKIFWFSNWFWPSDTYLPTMTSYFSKCWGYSERFSVLLSNREIRRNFYPPKSRRSSWYVETLPAEKQLKCMNCKKIKTLPYKTQKCSRPYPPVWLLTSVKVEGTLWNIWKFNKSHNSQVQYHVEIPVYEIS